MLWVIQLLLGLGGVAKASSKGVTVAGAHILAGSTGGVVYGAWLEMGIEGWIAVELLGDALLWGDLFGGKDSLVGQHGVLVAVLLGVEAMGDLEGVFNLLWVLSRERPSFVLLHIAQIQVQRVLQLISLDVRVFVDFRQKFLGVGSNLSRRSCPDMILNSLPIFSKVPQSLNEALMLIFGPSARCQLALRRRGLRGVYLVATPQRTRG